MNTIISDVRQALKERVDPEVLSCSIRYFKPGETAKVHGVRMGEVGKISRLWFQQIKGMPKRDIFALCEEFWKTGYLEEAVIACNWAESLHKQYEPADFKIFEHWVHDYLTNWADCDTLCNHTIGTFVMMYPEYVAELKKWAKSSNRWVRRAAAVTLIIPARKGLFLNDILEIADTLLLDKDDMVRKGYGWMLKAASLSEPTAAAKKLAPEIQKEHLDAVFNYVMKHRAVMPRTALRYAIEKMPADLRVKAMEK
jgi:3-methyladenine DNA glycosylase AlkD